MRSPESILMLYRDRKASMSTLHGKMQQIADIYNGRAEVPLADMDRSEMPSVPNLLQQGVDQMAGRISSVTPMVSFSSARPGIRKSDRAAHAASQSVTGWWQAERLMMKQKVRARRLIAYAMAPVVVRWDYQEHRPYRQVRHPLETFPSPDLQPGQVSPEDCIFSFTRSYGWLKENGYADRIVALINRREEPQRDALVTLIEYIDADHTVLMATGYYPSTHGQVGDLNGMSGIVLESYENLAKDCPVVIPTRLTLDEATGQFDGMMGMYYSQARLMALESIAVEKGVFPDTYLVSRPNEIGKFVDGPHDGRSGRINIIAGGDIRTEQAQPGYLTNPTIDRLERAQRVTSGIPAEFGGESQSNVRTGRRGDAILSATIDFPIADAQELFSYALEAENEVSIQLAKRIDGDTKRTIHVGTGNNRKPVTYVPTETFEVEEHVVSYPAAGSDVNSLVIGLGQRVGMGLMSKETAATLDPFIDNPEFEHDAIIAEGLEQALVSGIQQQAATGAIPPLTVAKIMTLVKSDRKELAEALQQVADDAAQEQAAMQASQQQSMSADQMNAGPTADALAGAMSPIPGASQGQKDLSTLMGELRKPQMTIVPGRNVSRGGM